MLIWIGLVPGLARADFCADPVVEVCAPGPWSRAQREARIEGVRKAVHLNQLNLVRGIVAARVVQETLARVKAAVINKALDAAADATERGNSVRAALEGSAATMRAMGCALKRTTCDAEAPQN